MAEFIVAIELGSSKMTGIAGKKNLDGSFNILAVVKEENIDCIRKGIIYNEDKTIQSLTNIIKKLEASLKTKIKQVYVGVGGQSIRSVKSTNIKTLPVETTVSQDMINELMDANRNMSYPEQEILDAVTLEYKLAESVLTPAEKRSGCLLVDLGADTTTVSIYSKNILRHLAVIPLGGNNITKDIASLQIEEKDAEKMKLEYGSAFTDNNDIDNSKKYPIDNDRNVDCRKFIDIVEARTQEIVENVYSQIPSEYIDKLLGGIILTGGGSNMKNIEVAFRNITHMDKIRIAKFVHQTINSHSSRRHYEHGIGYFS